MVLQAEKSSRRQETRIRCSAFNQRTTPEITGMVFRLAGDLVKEQQTLVAEVNAFCAP